MAYEIIKNAPSPRAAKNSRYPFEEMEVGDAFDIPLSGQLVQHGMPIEQNRVRTASFNYGKQHSKRFIVRKISSKNARCWRIT